MSIFLFTLLVIYLEKLTVCNRCMYVQMYVCSMYVYCCVIYVMRSTLRYAQEELLSRVSWKSLELWYILSVLTCFCSFGQMIFWLAFFQFDNLFMLQSVFLADFLPFFSSLTSLYRFQFQTLLQQLSSKSTSLHPHCPPEAHDLAFESTCSFICLHGMLYKVPALRTYLFPGK